ncbi:dTDP-4-amino-4,6-dideoxy-D-galactose acyltransferase [Rosenbergiella epipactidis]|uniref:dTDP-4-amino-4,6-dideoxy-D-galactose acyltransferase n=1 Tax=Rosenbergiella epipactidis TaxID=1544694 RepID=UPI001F4D3808|nr:dTDP-4-amino-4,6-dideoxy-D-galactose acyltransferase [Rosenbergiella epipactidis]
MTIDLLAWESAFFSQRVGKVDLAELDRLSVEECADWDMVQAKVSSTDYQSLDTLTGKGFALVEGEAELVIPITETTRQSGIRIARPAHIDALRHLAGSLFTGSRFRAPWFDHSLTQQFYAQWIENAVQGTFDDQCLLTLDEQGGVSGFVSLRHSAHIARIGLLGVASTHQGAGLGQQLLLAATDWARSKGLSELHITTQLSNVSAMRLYLRHGARLTSTSYWLYRKRDDSV